MSKIMFSLLVHEEPIVILDQIVNLFKYNPNSSVVVHFNPNFNRGESVLTCEELLNIFSDFKNIYVNPNRLKVGKDDIIQAHLSNFRFVENVEFDYFYFIASNELFLKTGAEEFVSGYRYGCMAQKKPNWHFIENLRLDSGLQNIYSYLNKKEYYYSQIEGSFYNKDIMSKIVSIIEMSYDFHVQNQTYPRDEIYFSTIAVNLYGNENRYDGCLCKIKWQGKILFTSINAVKEVFNQKSSYFTVKRVDRKIDDYLRCYIRHYLLKYENDFEQYYHYDFKNPKIWRIKVKDFALWVKYFCRDKLAKVYRFIFRKK